MFLRGEREMSVIVKNVIKGSPAYKKGIKGGDILVSLNGNSIIDVLDYRFFQNDKKIVLEFLRGGRSRKKTIKKDEYEELGLEFETYLMDKQRSCLNKCIFCFIDQMPKGMRESLYFKDDDSRLSFLFGNYITLTNITEHEIERIIKMHISPINISVHTTNPELRVKMMKNKNAGRVLDIIDRLNAAGISMNCQLVLVPGYNDCEELERSLKDLSQFEYVRSVSAVPVGLTGHREGLEQLKPFDKISAEKTLDIIEKYQNICLQKYNERRFYAADEFYILANRDFPKAEFYEDFLQLENGVGLCSLLRSEVSEAVLNSGFNSAGRKISIATGTAAYPLISELVALIKEKWQNIDCQVFEIKNNFFAGKITVAGLITGTDIIEQLKGKDLGTNLLIPSSMLRHENDKFLDDITLEELEEKLNVKVVAVNNNGQEFLDAVLGIEGQV